VRESPGELCAGILLLYRPLLTRRQERYETRTRPWRPSSTACAN